MNYYACDFETTTDANDCRVWASGCYDIENETFDFGNSIEHIIHHFENHPFSIYFYHNLRFDGEFLISWLLNNGYEWKNKKDLRPKTFTTLIGGTNLFYSITIAMYNDERGELNTIELRDSLKLINMPISDIPKSFGIENIAKGSINYDKYRPIGHILDEDEIFYLKNDCVILGKALKKVLFEYKMTKITQGSNALQEIKSYFTKKQWEYYFPFLENDDDLRNSYKGGFTWCNPKFQNIELGEGLVLDVNSLYPWVMHDCLLPFGKPLYFNGKYKKDKNHPLYIQNIRCSFELKKDKIPTIQIKKSMFFNQNEYLSSSKDKNGNEQEIVLCLTNVDLDLFLEHYDVFNLEYLEGWKFRGTDKLFKNFVEHWSKIKIEANNSKNWGLRTWSKVMLNSSYGKYGTNPKSTSKIPYLDENGVVKYSQVKEERKPLYIPIASFITAYAREKTIRSAQKNYHRVAYCDTDSLHLIGNEIPKDLDIHQSKLGAWKIENKFKRAKFLRQKSYCEEILDEKENKYFCKITCAGMRKNIRDRIGWDDFYIGAEFYGNLKHKSVKGGVVLVDSPFKIK